ncbi:hypothetical protein EHV15_35320 [Paenibacillus oralis]|uniref:Uncharacterized protein n=1 Tax=Paenibacillus oralis TaxID=2490856 RepID=A0A3P3T9Y4_9BACL|nr:hypothetical protein [Paenibacillus oralis]RRJ54846.1 hypothetical protein EHV15_35320 [Paenibacillus oralis]
MSGKWDTPQIVTDTDIAFGGNIDNLLPPLSEIPKEFINDWTKWHQLADDLFYDRPLNITISDRAGIDVHAALRHIRAILNSFKPDHDHKIAGVAFLLSMFYEDISFE